MIWINTIIYIYTHKKGEEDTPDVSEEIEFIFESFNWSKFSSWVANIGYFFIQLLKPPFKIKGAFFNEQFCLQWKNSKTYTLSKQLYVKHEIQDYTENIF